MNGPINIYYDDEGDFLEITISNPPEESYCEDVNEEVFVRKTENSGEIIGIGILNFRENSKHMQEILSKIPIKINFESI